jgi:hypothetical protein
MSAYSQSLAEAEEDTRKSRLIMKVVRAEMDAATHPSIRAELQEELCTIALSWFVRQVEIEEQIDQLRKI